MGGLLVCTLPTEYLDGSEGRGVQAVCRDHGVHPSGSGGAFAVMGEGQVLGLEDTGTSVESFPAALLDDESSLVAWPLTVDDEGAAAFSESGVQSVALGNWWESALWGENNEADGIG